MGNVNSGTSRILYIGMVCTQAYGRAIGQDAFVGAAAGKMSGVISALRLADRRALLVSIPYVTRGPDRQPSKVCHADGFPAYFLPIRRHPVARKLFGAFALAWFAIRKVKPQDTVLFYNHAIEYVLALFVLRIRKISVFQDIEDVPTSGDGGLRGKADRLGYRLMSSLASQRKVTVSDQIGRSLGLTDYMAIQGIASQDNKSASENRWKSLEAGAPLRVHFGGSLSASTGLALFCSAVKELDTRASELARDITFVVTGTGDIASIEATVHSLDSDRLRFEVNREIDRHAYFGLLDSCHTSLCLKNPYAELANTTFPSKVIEITSHGIALVTSRVSDIGEIFAADEAWQLIRYGPTELAEILMYMAANPEEVRRRAEAGAARARDRFDPLAVGHSLAAFLEAGPVKS